MGTKRGNKLTLKKNEIKVRRGPGSASSCCLSETQLFSIISAIFLAFAVFMSFLSSQFKKFPFICHASVWLNSCWWLITSRFQCDLMDGRDAFLTMAREKHYEFSSLRRCKYSTLVLVYELHTQVGTFFFFCCNPVPFTQSWPNPKQKGHFFL